MIDAEIRTALITEVMEPSLKLERDVAKSCGSNNSLHGI
jgi:hypothetical protein